MLDRAGGKKLSALYDGLPKSWGSPTMAPYCPDDTPGRSPYRF